MCPYTRNVPCFVALFALISPRLAIFLLWIFSDRLTIAFTSGWVGILGFLFLPWTMLAWAVCYAHSSEYRASGGSSSSLGSSQTSAHTPAVVRPLQANPPRAATGAGPGGASGSF